MVVVKGVSEWWVVKEVSDCGGWISKRGMGLEQYLWMCAWVSSPFSSSGVQ